jgi:hypothetical protein
MIRLFTGYYLHRVRVIVLNTTFKNISVISLQTVLMVGETGVPAEKHRPAASY